MNILFTVPYAPTLIRVRPYNLVRALARRGHRVTLATLWETEAERAALGELKAQGFEVMAERLSPARKGWNLLGALPGRTPLQAAYCWQPALARAIAARLGADRFDVVHVEHLRGARYGLSALGLHPSSFILHPSSLRQSPIPIIWDSVDCISYLFEQAAAKGRGAFGRLVTRLELPRTRRYEGWLAGQFDRVLVTSPVDKAALEELAAGQRQQAAIEVLPNGVDLAYFSPDGAIRDPATVLFSGKMSYHANDAAAQYLAGEVMPRVWAQRPDAKLVIAGSGPSAAVHRLAAQNAGRVEVTGFLPDLRVPLRRATVAAAPLLYGAGIQNKVLEAMACGTPVVASPLAVSALEHVRTGADCLVAESPDAFAEAILRLIEDRRLCEEMGAAGRRYVEQHHDWDEIAGRLENVYEDERRDCHTDP